MLRFWQKGDWEKTRADLKKMSEGDIFSDLDRYGEMGVQALSLSTPVRTGKSAGSWGYRVIDDGTSPGIEWYNTNQLPDGTPVVILIQYGHGTGTGGYVVGRDFINPTMRVVFDQIADDVWKKVMN